MGLDYAVPGDYDGQDGWEPAEAGTSTWETAGSAGTIELQRPEPGWDWRPLAVPGDYDGDGDTDPAWYHLEDGTWHLAGATGPVEGGRGVDELGDLADSPVPADFDGDGTTDFGVYSPTEGTLTIPGQPTITDLPIGLPVTGEIDDSPGIDLVIYQPEQTQWVLPDGTIIDPPGSGPLDVLVPAVADYDGDGTDELVLFDDGTGTWTSETGAVLAHDPRARFGFATTIPSHTIDEYLRLWFVQSCLPPLGDPEECEL